MFYSGGLPDGVAEFGSAEFGAQVSAQPGVWADMEPEDAVEGDGLCGGTTAAGLPCRRLGVHDGFCSSHRGAV